MKICNLSTEDGNFIGLKQDGKLWISAVDNEEPREASSIDQSLKLKIDPARLKEKLMKNLQPVNLNEEEVKFNPVVLSPGKIICVGLNYRSHASEVNDKLMETPVLFSKFSDSVLQHNGSVRIDEFATDIDYEAELGILIGSHTFRIQRKDSLKHVFGYFPANDISARDLQYRTSQWLLGKTLPGYAPIGPYVTTTDEIQDPNSLNISLRLNGEIRQNSNTSNMIFQCDYLIWYISNYIPLEPGDIILTGTPEGVIYGKPPDQRVWIKKGDITEVSIERLGNLVTKFV